MTMTMTKDEVKEIVAGLLESGEFAIEVDDAQVAKLIEPLKKEVETLKERVAVLETEAIAHHPGYEDKPARIEKIRSSAAKVKVRMTGAAKKEVAA